MFDPWIEKILWRREWQPTLVFLPREYHGQRSLAGYSPWEHRELDMTEWLTHTLRWNPHSNLNSMKKSKGTDMWEYGYLRSGITALPLQTLPNSSSSRTLSNRLLSWISPQHIVSSLARTNFALFRKCCVAVLIVLVRILQQNRNNRMEKQNPRAFITRNCLMWFWRLQSESGHWRPWDADGLLPVWIWRPENQERRWCRFHSKYRQAQDRKS